MPETARMSALLVNMQSILAAGKNVDRILDAAVGNGLSAIPCADGAIVEMRDKENLVLRAASGAASRFVGRRIGMSSSFAGHSIAAARALLCSDVEQLPAIDPSLYSDVGMRAIISVPLVRDGAAVGALKFYSKEPDAFADQDLATAKLIANHLTAGLVMVWEITALQRRLKSAAHFEAIAEALPQFVWTMNREGKALYWNRSIEDFIATHSIEAVGRDVLSIVDPDFRDEVAAIWAKACDGDAAVSFECRVRAPSGTAHWVLIHLAPAPGAAKDTREWVGAATVIDERKGAEADLQSALDACQLLLLEANHRIKNNLQIVTGLLALHASRIAHPQAKARLLDARTQINTIAQVHQLIYQSGQTDEVEFVGFLRNLATGLVGRGPTSRAELVFDAPPELLLPIERGIPVALVAGEIITNALKHGTSLPNPRITVSIAAEDDGCVIDIADNGPGLPANFDPDRSTGLGMEIIFGFTKQAGGHIEIARDGAGARFRLHLPASRSDT